MKKELYVIIAITIVLIGVTIRIFSFNKSLINISTNKFNVLVNKGESMLVYVGRPTCPECAEIEPQIKAILKANDVKAYYWNTDKAKKESMDTFNEMKESQSITTVPIIIEYKDFKEVNRYDNKQFVESKESLEAFIKEYKSGINK